MTAEAAGTMAQIIPVFLIALIAEQYRYSPKVGLIEQVARALEQALIAAVMFAVEVAFIWGAIRDGLSVDHAVVLFALTVVLLAIVLISWFARNSVLTEVVDRMATWVLRGFVGLLRRSRWGESFISSLRTGMLNLAASDKSGLIFGGAERPLARRVQPRQLGRPIVRKMVSTRRR
jgi:hypothetical protein